MAAEKEPGAGTVASHRVKAIAKKEANGTGGTVPGTRLSHVLVPRADPHVGRKPTVRSMSTHRNKAAHVTPPVCRGRLDRAAPQAGAWIRVTVPLEAPKPARKSSWEAREGCVPCLFAFQHVFMVTNDLAVG